MHINLTPDIEQRLARILELGSYSSTEEIIIASLQEFELKLFKQKSKSISVSDDLTVADLPGEIWKQIPNYHHYEASNLGRIRSLRFNRIKPMKPTVIQRNYRQVNLRSDNKGKQLLVHRLIALTFIPNTDGKLEVNHLDGDKSNNNVSNLEWSSNRENIAHAVDSGIRPRGENHYRSKLKRQDIIAIRAAYESGQETYKQLAARFCVSPATIGSVVNGEHWSHIIDMTSTDRF